MLTVDPYIPIALWLPLALAAIAAIAVYARRLRGRTTPSAWRAIVLLMTVTVALPLIVLLNLTWVTELPPPAGKPLLTLLVDRSASMATADLEGETRYAKAVEIAQQLSEELDARFEVKVRAFDTRSEIIELEALESQSLMADATNLAAAIEQSLDERPQGQAIVLIGDGIHNSGGGIARVRASIEKARAMAAPIYTQTLGGESDVDDLAITLDLPQEMAFAGQTLPVNLTIRQRGTLTDKATVRLLLDGEEVQQQEVEIQPDGKSRATLDLKHDQSGLYRYEVVVDEHPSEVTPLNNRVTLLVRVVDEPVKVLVLEGKPYWDSKFLLRMLAGDSAIELTSVIRVAPDRFVKRQVLAPGKSDTAPDAESTDNDPASSRQQSWDVLSSADEVLSDAEALDEYQVIVLGRDAEVYLDDRRVELVKRWLAEQGGSLVCMRGAPSSVLSQRLGSLMPVRWTPANEKRFRVELTESGESMSWLPATESEIRGLPSLATVARPERPKPLAVVLASAATGAENAEPVITYQPLGSGRVVVVEGAGMWRWAFLPSQHEERDQVYGQLWRSLIRWLVSSTGLLPTEMQSLRSDKVTFDPAEGATATLLVRDAVAGDPPQVELSGDALQQPRTLPTSPAGDVPGQFRVMMGELPEGRYQLRVVGAEEDDASSTAAFDVKGNLSERLSIAARSDLMRVVAEGSGGAVLEETDATKLATVLEEKLAENYPLRVQRIAAWDRWWVLVCVLGLWAVSWGVRRRAGLV